jgi:hypothetical protein
LTKAINWPGAEAVGVGGVGSVVGIGVVVGADVGGGVGAGQTQALRRSARAIPKPNLRDGLISNLLVWFWVVGKPDRFSRPIRFNVS